MLFLAEPVQLVQELRVNKRRVHGKHSARLPTALAKGWEFVSQRGWLSGW